NALRRLSLRKAPYVDKVIKGTTEAVSHRTTVVGTIGIAKHCKVGAVMLLEKLSSEIGRGMLVKVSRQVTHFHMVPVRRWSVLEPIYLRHFSFHSLRPVLCAAQLVSRRRTGSKQKEGSYCPFALPNDLEQTLLVSFEAGPITGMLALMC